MSQGKKVFLIVALLYILYIIFPLFADIIQIPVWLPSLAAVVIMVCLYPKAFSNKTIYWFLAYAAVLGIYVLVRKPLTVGIGTVADPKKIFIEFAYILPTLSIFNVLNYLDDKELLRKLVNWSLLILFVSFIVATPLLLRYESLRAALHDKGEVLAVPGLPGYSLMHAYTLFVPLICYLWKVLNGWKKWAALVGLLVLCFVIYSTFVTTSLILMTVVLVFAVFYSDKNILLLWMLTMFGGIVLYILYEFGFFISVIDWVMPAFEGTAVEPKLFDIKASMLQGELTGGTITGRQNLHAISWNSFFQNPFFGTSIVGGHSSLIDRFGGMGVLAGIPFLMIIVSFIRQMAVFYQTRMAKTFFWIGIIVGFIFLYMKGNWGCESWLVYVVLMPMGILSIEIETQSDGTEIS